MTFQCTGVYQTSLETFSPQNLESNDKCFYIAKASRFLRKKLNFLKNLFKEYHHFHEMYFQKH